MSSLIEFSRYVAVVICAITASLNGAQPTNQLDAIAAIVARANPPTSSPPALAIVRAKSSVELHVSLKGNDAARGTRTEPFRTLERARDAIRESKPLNGVTIVVHGGSYPIRQTFQLTANDSGTSNAPISYRAAEGETPVFTGGVTLKGFEITRDESVLLRLPMEARGKVMQVNLRALGVTNILPLQLGGFGSGRGFKTHPVMELFFNGEPLQLARWPNNDFVQIAKISTNDGHSIHNIRGSKTGVFNYEGDRPLRWKGEKDVRLYGYWFWDWADSYEKVARIDTENREITLDPPFHTYGYRKGQRFFALNLLSEIDTPGEWFLDRDSGILYLWPPGDPNRAVVELSAAPFTFLELKNVSHVRFEGLTWDLGSADAVSISGGTNVLIAGCTVKRFAGRGISIAGGQLHGLVSCDVFSLGRGGIQVAGGDRKTLARGNHFVENCHVFDLSRIDHTYTPAVQVSGVGQNIAHNLMHHIRSSAINLGGNDHLVEFNEAGRVVQESDDQGAVDMWGNPTFRGNVFRWNYFHHIGPWMNARTEPALGQAGIRLDDAISGVLIYQNIFRHAATGKHGFGGIQIHGGKDNVIDGNVFVDCAQAVSFSPWGEARWLEHLQKYVGSSEIDFALYTKRYPELAYLRTNANVNFLSGNRFVNCERVLHHNRAARLISNSEMKESADYTAALTSFPIPPNAVALVDIPLQQIGLHTDLWRKTLPADLIRNLRSDE